MDDLTGETAERSASSRRRQEELEPGSPEEMVPFGKYILLGRVGRGGMAEVYRSRAASGVPPELLAIKCMRPSLARENRFVEMFIREGKLAMMLDHPGIVRTFDVGSVDGHYFITMEYLGGKDLNHVLRRCQESGRRIPIPHALHIARVICEALHYAHELCTQQGRPLNIVNRDVSPANIRIAYDGRVKLLDFGIAQAVLQMTSEIGVLKGKFSYMSPEQIRGLPLDRRTDVFSCGIVLHEMLTCERLFRDDSEFVLMEMVRRAEVKPPSVFNPRVPPELDAVVMKALERDAANRYQDAASLARDLEERLKSYQFSRSELAELVRGLFQQDHRKEQAIVAACLAAERREDQHRAPGAPDSSPPRMGHRQRSRRRARFSKRHNTILWAIAAALFAAGAIMLLLALR